MTCVSALKLRDKSGPRPAFHMLLFPEAAFPGDTPAAKAEQCRHRMRERRGRSPPARCRTDGSLREPYGPVAIYIR